MQELLWAEAYRIGLPLGNINISLNTKTPDGGIDATVVWPVGFAGSSSMIVDGYTAYQVKSGKSIEPWKEPAIQKELFDKRTLAKEHLGSMVRDVLDRDGRYILVDFGHDLTSDQRNTAIGHLERFLRESCGYPLPKVDVWSRNNLESFLIPFPSLTLNLKGIVKEFQTHASWSRDDTMRVAFVHGESQDVQMQTLQGALRGDTFHVHVTGEPGIGKTRLVLEATRAEDLRPLVMYVTADQFWNSALLYSLIQEDTDYSAILVVDECNSEKRALILNKLKVYAPRIRVISIYTESDRPDSDGYLGMKPLGLAEVGQILQGYRVPGDIAQKWAPECGGSPRVAHLVGINLQNNPDDMLREPDTERVWDRFIEGGDDPKSEDVRQRRTVLMYLSLFKRFGFAKPVDDEARAIQLLIQEHDQTITWLRFNEIIRQLRVQKLLQGETTLYITPKLLQIKLWVDWWEKVGAEGNIGNILNTLSPTLVEWFIEMFEYAAGSEAASKTASALLGTTGLFRTNPEVIQSGRGARFFRYLAAIDPDAAVRCLQLTIGKWDRESLLQFTVGRREIIYMLERSARWSKLFGPSAELLLQLADAENESWTNNASGIFAELFTISGHPKLSVTETPAIERLPILAKALDSTSVQRRKIAIEACNRALNERTFGSVDSSVRVFDREPQLWVPTTWAEVFDYYRSVWRLLLSKLDALTDEEHQRISSILAENTRNLGKLPDLAEPTARDVMTLASKPYVDDRHIYRVVTELLRYNINLTPEVRSTWERVRDSLIGSDYHSRMKRYVGMYLSEDFVGDSDARTRQQQTKFQELIIDSFDHLEQLRQEIPWLVTDSAINGYQFGYALAKRDSKFHLLAEIVDCQKNVVGVSGLYFLAGYLRGVSEFHPQSWEELMDKFAENPTTATWVPTLTLRVGQISPQAARRVIQVLEDWSMPVELLDQFTYGHILNGLPEALFNEWLEFLLAHKDPIAPYVALGLCYGYYVRSDEPTHLPRESTLALLTNNSLRSVPANIRQGNFRTMIPFYWESLAEAFIAQFPEDSLELSEFLLKHFECFDCIMNDDRPRRMLRKIIERHPDATWEQVAVRLESSSWHLTQWLRGDDFFGQPREQDLPILPLFPQEQVWRWVEDDVDERAWYLATFVPPSFDERYPSSSMARELLVRYGHRDDVRRNLQANFNSEGWTGDESAHLTQKLQHLLRYRSREPNDGVLSWLDEYVEYLRERIKRARIEEERRVF